MTEIRMLPIGNGQFRAQVWLDGTCIFETLPVRYAAEAMAALASAYDCEAFYEVLT